MIKNPIYFSLIGIGCAYLFIACDKPSLLERNVAEQAFHDLFSELSMYHKPKKLVGDIPANFKEYNCKHPIVDSFSRSEYEEVYITFSCSSKRILVNLTYWHNKVQPEVRYLEFCGTKNSLCD